ncbi:hypothetical protein HanXRQr2_Chr14g0623681 [Helianthus annuus]|uniref:Uncharacterized protein n=1 Tax=Helianthus annuus TaxID=4232 RepID=A0A9K3H4V3_HELAN|nr:hypothetical protein HanXRQr2_Chr14g0623681 [Helianthus annuus]KAJ0838753.1 hypothetical protein HanPSC8_Chr14g0598521 [Helianthus annuus]
MIAKVESCMPTRSLMRMNRRIHQRLKRSLVLFHMVHPLILMFGNIFAPVVRSLSSRLRYLSLWT